MADPAGSGGGGDCAPATNAASASAKTINTTSTSSATVQRKAENPHFWEDKQHKGGNDDLFSLGFDTKSANRKKVQWLPSSGEDNGSSSSLGASSGEASSAPKEALLTDIFGDSSEASKPHLRRANTITQGTTGRITATISEGTISTNSRPTHRRSSSATNSTFDSLTASSVGGNADSTSFRSREAPSDGVESDSVGEWGVSFRGGEGKDGSSDMRPPSYPARGYSAAGVSVDDNGSKGTAAVAAAGGAGDHVDDFVGRKYPLVRALQKRLAPYLRHVSRVSHFCIAALLAWMAGSLGMSALWAIGVLWVATKIDANRLRRINVRRQRDIESEQYHTVVRDQSTIPPELADVSDSQRQFSRGQETCAWLNTLIIQLWPHMRKTMQDGLDRKLRQLLEKQMNLNRPGMVENAVFKSISIGKTPPRLSNVTATVPEALQSQQVSQRARDASPFDFRWDFDLLYAGDADVTLSLALGGKHVKMTVPIAVRDFCIEGRVRMDCTLFPMYPYLHQASFSFIDTPKTVELSMKPLKTFDMMDVPGIQSWLKRTLRDLIEFAAVLPQRMEMPYFYMFNVSPAEVAANATTFAQLHQEHMLSEKAVANDTVFGGLLHVRLLEARQLRTEGRIKPTAAPYCILTCGAGQILSSRPVKDGLRSIRKGGSVRWDEFFELIVRRDRIKLEITVLGRNPDGDDFFGSGVLYFNKPEFTRESAKEVWVNLEDTTTGKVHLSVRYIKEPRSILSSYAAQTEKDVRMGITRHFKFS